MLANEFNWGQSNINFQSKGIKAEGGWRFVVPHHEEAPLSLYPLWLTILMLLWTQLNLPQLVVLILHFLQCVFHLFDQRGGAHYFHVGAYAQDVAY